MTVNVYPVTDGKGQRIGDAMRRTDGTTRIRLNRSVVVHIPRSGEPDSVYLYVNPVPEILTDSKETS